jgi:osmotically inducible lipoprotein OsmB
MCNPHWLRVRIPFQADIQHRGGKMKTTWKYSISAVAAAVLIGLGGCAGMSTQDKGTATGAVVGGVAGNVLGGGSLLGTAAGAAVGGVVGHEVTKPK